MLPGREDWTGVKVAGAATVDAVDTVEVCVTVLVTVDLDAPISSLASVPKVCREVA